MGEEFRCSRFSHEPPPGRNKLCTKGSWGGWPSNVTHDRFMFFLRPMLGRVGSPIIRVLRPTMKSSCFVFSMQPAKYVENGRRQHMASGHWCASHSYAIFILRALHATCSFRWIQREFLEREDLQGAVPIPNRHCSSTKSNSAMLGLCIAAMFQRAHRRCVGLDLC